jgi:iron(III) transport system substrate-binding protein
LPFALRYAPSLREAATQGERRIIAIALALAVLIAAFALPAAAQNWTAERAKLVAAAEQEGSLIVYALPNQVTREFMIEEWTKAHPKIPISATVAQAPQFIARIRAERSAEKYLWDVAFTGHPAGYTLAKEGVLDPLRPEMVDPEVDDPKIWGGWDHAFVDNAGKYVLATSAYLGSPNYNALLVPPEKVERLGLKVLLEPEYAGKTVWQDPFIPGAGRSGAFLVHKQLGDDGLRKLVVDRKVVFLSRHHQVVEAMARGTAWFGIGGAVMQEVEPYQKAGVKLDIRMFGKTPDKATLSQGGQTLYVFDKRPHPAATRLFVNWVLGKEFQTRISKVLGQGSRRLDVPHVDPDTTPLPGAAYDAPQRESYVPKIEAAVRLVRELRQQAK